MQKSTEAGLTVRGYVSCVCGCPYEGKINPSEVAKVKIIKINLKKKSMNLFNYRFYIKKRYILYFIGEVSVLGTIFFFQKYLYSFLKVSFNLAFLHEVVQGSRECLLIRT